jgi:RimJ/RimL family protein N-acetyltransferase
LKVHLRSVTSEDIAYLRVLVSDPIIHKSLIRNGHYERFYSYLEAKQSSDAVQHFVAKSDIDGRIIGGACVEKKEFSYFVDPNYWRLGWGGAIAKAVLQSIRKYNSDTIFLYIDRNNFGSIKIAEKLGFKFSGFYPRSNANSVVWLRYYYT